MPVIRAYRPEAEQVVVRAKGSIVELSRIHPAGVFEGVVPGAQLPLD